MIAHRAISAAPRCHHSNGELYSVRFARDSVTLSSYEADANRTGHDLAEARFLHSITEHNTPLFSLSEVWK
jgi:hypothetical protein